MVVVGGASLQTHKLRNDGISRIPDNNRTLHTAVPEPVNPEQQFSHPNDLQR